MKNSILLLLVIITSFPTLAAKLSPKHLEKLSRGEIITLKERVNKSPWPMITHIAVIPSRPIEAIAVFSAYDRQKNYTPNMLISAPIKERSPTDILAYYKMKMPWPLSDSEYIHGAKLSSSAKDHYQLEWYMVKSNVTDKIFGQASFSPYNGDKTLFTYKTAIWPRSSLAGLFKSKMVKDVLKSYKIIIDEIKKNKTDPALILKLKSRISDALASKSVYTDIISNNLKNPINKTLKDFKP